MSVIWLILGMGVGVYALRISGLVIPSTWGTRPAPPHPVVGTTGRLIPLPKPPPIGSSAPGTPAALPAWERALEFLPVALLTALVVASLTGPEAGDPARLLAAAGAALVARLTGRMWACILSGMILYLLLGLI